MALLLTCVVLTAAGCGSISSAGQGEDSRTPVTQTPAEQPTEQLDDSPVTSPSQPSAKPPVDQGGASNFPAAPQEQTKSSTSGSSGAEGKEPAIQVVANPADIAVLVNKSNKLPENYKPKDLVEPNVPFIFKEKSEKRTIRQEAATALEELFEAAEKDGLSLAGVSGYRSHAIQRSLYNNYVQRDGEAAANKYSAKPGHSEHETGLAIDVTGSNGKCPAQDCFAATKEAKWLEEHASEYGFIIRYPKGKQSITGYQYEPWHLRYVGKNAAKEIAKQDITLEEYTNNGIPVTKPK
ncbi:M15 family metallopeptidase [Paenibacillus sp. PvR052]